MFDIISPDISMYHYLTQIKKEFNIDIIALR